MTLPCRFNFDVRKGPVKIEWFVGAETNLSYNCLDRHVEAGHGDRIAFYWEGNDLGEDCRITYSQLLDQACILAPGSQHQHLFHPSSLLQECCFCTRRTWQVSAWVISFRGQCMPRTFAEVLMMRMHAVSGRLPCCRCASWRTT